MNLRQNKYVKIFMIENGAIIYNKQTRKSCILGEMEYKVYSLLDGTKELEDISVLCQVDEDALTGLLQIFNKYELLECNEIDNPPPKAFLGKRTLFYGIRYPRFISSSIFRRFMNMLFLLSFPLLIASVFFMNGKVNIDEIIKSVNVIHLLTMDIFLAVSISIHEFFHALFAHINGAFCAEIGYKFDFLCPVAYTTLCGVNRIPSKYKKIQIFLSGMASNAFIASISLLAMNSPALNNNIFLFMIFSVNLCLIIVNCITAGNTDLYLVFTVLSNDCYLRRNALQSIKNKTLAKNLFNFMYLLFTFVLQPAIIIMLLAIALMKI